MKRDVACQVLFLVIMISIGCSHSGNPEDSLSDTNEVIDLASDHDWQLSVDDGPWRGIRVPGGGYNSDLQDDPLIDQSDVKDHVTYKRTLNLAELPQGKVARIEFGGVNHGCEVYLDGHLIGSHVGPMMPFAVEITDYIRPGTDQELRVVSYPQWHFSYEVPHGFVYTEARRHPQTRVDFDPEPGWASKFSYGITKYIHIHILPEVFVEDVFVRPSVAKRNLLVDLWIRNTTGESKVITIRQAFVPWNHAKWNYPEINTLTISLKPKETRKITTGPVEWELGQESYWWPNKPFRDDYRAVLHNLNISLFERKALVDRKVQRFGFVEWSEGPFYYQVNGVRINQISDGTPESAMSDYDCYTSSPAFMPPTDSSEGCPETWKRYMRMGISANRTHQSTPTPYMMDVADELGFMLIPETAIRGCQLQKWHDIYLPRSAVELARLSRNHPSVCRYSLQNEADPAWAAKLADSIITVDPLRPLVFEDNQVGRPCRIDGKTGHAFAMLHYVNYPKPSRSITGMGEFAWNWTQHSPGVQHAGGGLEEFIYYATDMRLWDISYAAGWDFINYWPNFLEGMNHENHAWKQSCYPGNRIDSIDGWHSPIIHWAKKYLHPYLVLDTDLHRLNRPGSDLTHWPSVTTSYHSGDTINRELALFNDGLSGNTFDLTWEARWDSSGGQPVTAGNINGINIEPGFHKEFSLTLIAPQTNMDQRKLFIILKYKMGETELFHENDIYFWIHDWHQDI